MKRFQAAVLLILFGGSILSYLWYGRFHYHHRWWITATYLAAGAAVLFAFRIFPQRSRWGLSPMFPAGVGRVFGLPTLAGTVLIVTAGWFADGSVEAVGKTWGELPQYLLWAALQQFLLHHFLRRLSEVVLVGSQAEGFRRSVGGALLAACQFAVFHLPHPVLAPLTLAAALFWCLAFGRTPSLAAATLSHFLLAGTLLVTGQGRVLDSFGVGKPGFRYEGYGHGVQVAAGYGPHGEALIVTLPGPDRKTPSLVQVFSPDGRRQAAWTAFPEFGYSARMAVGELGYGPGDELAIVPGPGSGNPALVRIFTLEGRRLAEFPVGALSSGYGAYVSVVCGGLLLGAGPAPGAAPFVVWTDAAGKTLRQWDLSGRVDFVSGIKAWALPGKCPPDGLVVGGSEVSVNAAEFAVISNGETVRVPAYPATYGINLASLAAGEGEAAVAVAPGPLRGYPRWVRIFGLRGGKWEMLDDFVVAGPEPGAGLNLAALDLERDGTPELVVGEGSAFGFPPRVRVVDRFRQVLWEWDARGVRGGVARTDTDGHGRTRTWTDMDGHGRTRTDTDGRKRHAWTDSLESPLTDLAPFRGLELRIEAGGARGAQTVGHHLSGCPLEVGFQRQPVPALGSHALAGRTQRQQTFEPGGKLPGFVKILALEVDNQQQQSDGNPEDLDEPEEVGELGDHLVVHLHGNGQRACRMGQGEDPADQRSQEASLSPITEQCPSQQESDQTPGDEEDDHRSGHRDVIRRLRSQPLRPLQEAHQGLMSEPAKDGTADQVGPAPGRTKAPVHEVKSAVQQTPGHRDVQKVQQEVNPALQRNPRLLKKEDSHAHSLDQPGAGECQRETCSPAVIQQQVEKREAQVAQSNGHQVGSFHGRSPRKRSARLHGQGPGALSSPGQSI